MVFDKIEINDRTFEADGQLTIADELVKITTTDGPFGLYLTQLENSTLSVRTFKDEQLRFEETKMTLKNLTVVGGNYRVELMRPSS